MRSTILRLSVLVIILSSATGPHIPGPAASDARLSTAPLSPNPLTVDFTWFKFLLVGQSVNFTGLVSNGTPPYTYNWDFGDGQNSTVFNVSSILHTYASPGNLTVMLTVADSGIPPSILPTSKPIVVLFWPVSYANWIIPFNITSNDGVNIWNVLYHGNAVIEDARVAGILVQYKNSICLFNDEFVSEYTDIGYFEYSSGPDPYLQIRDKSQLRSFSLVGGYWYEQVWRFYASGRWDAEVWFENGGGCGADHTYEMHLRVDPAAGTSGREFMSQYTSTGWKNLVWEGNYTDNGFRDTSHNDSQWRFGSDWKYYYITPSTTRTWSDLPAATSRIYLVASKPNEIEQTPNQLYDVENPYVWVSPGELGFNRDITFWYLEKVWVHAPLAHINGRPPNKVTLSFYPVGP